MFNLKFFLIAAIALTVLGGVGSSQGSTLLFDRGLPIFNADQPNLNNSAGDNRSNNRLYQDLGETFPTGYKIPGDDFTIGQVGQTYHIDILRLWATHALPWTIVADGNIQVWMGPAAGPITSLIPVSTAYTYIPVRYSNGAYYQTVEGGWRQLLQVDVTFNMDVAGGVKYWFFVDGIFHSPINGHYYSNNLHASNAALSNATEEGADGIFHWLELTEGIPVQIVDQNSILPSGLGGDGNLQIFGDAVPLPSTVILLGFGLLGLTGWRKIKKG